MESSSRADIPAGLIASGRLVLRISTGDSTLVTIEQFIEQFLSAVDFQEPVELKPDTKLSDLPEWDSLSALATIVLFDTEYGKVIVGPDLAKCGTVRDLYALMG